MNPKFHPILEAGQTPEEGKTYTLIESYFQTFSIVDDPFETTRSVDESTGETVLVERRVRSGPMKIRGIFQYEGRQNANKRIYPRGLWEKHLKADAPLMKRVSERMVRGQIEHPENGVGRLDQTAILVTGLKLGKVETDGSRSVIGEAEVLDTPQGRVVRDLIRSGVKIGISSRGSGTVDARGFVDERTYSPETWDIVGNPSTPGAYPDVVESSDDPAPLRVVSKENGRLYEYVDESGNILATIPAALDQPNQTRSPVVDMKQQFESLRTSIGMYIDLDVTRCNESQLRKMSDTMSQALVQLGSIAESDATLKMAADDLRNRISRKNSEIEEAIRDLLNSDDDDNSRPVSESVDDDDDTFDGVDDEEDVDEEDGQSSSKVPTLEEARRLLEKARGVIRSQREQLEAAEALTEQFAEELARTEAERNELSETVAAAYAVIAELSSDTPEEVEDVQEAVEEAIDANPALANIRQILERCQTVEEVNQMVEHVGTTPRNRNSLPLVGQSRNSLSEQTIGSTHRKSSTPNGGGSSMDRSLQIMASMNERRNRSAGQPVNG